MGPEPTYLLWCRWRPVQPGDAQRGEKKHNFSGAHQIGQAFCYMVLAGQAG